MARYVMANLRAGRATAAARVEARLAMGTSFSQLFSHSVEVLRHEIPPDIERREVVTFEADDVEVAAKRRQLPPDVVLEPQILHFPVRPFPPMDLHRPQRASRLPPGMGRTVTVDVRATDGRPLAHAQVDAYFRGPQQTIAEAGLRTDGAGRATLDFDPAWHLAAVIVSPYSGHWSYLLRSPADAQVDVHCEPLPPRADWWLRRLPGLAHTLDGRGVRVGVVDTGCGPHPALQHVRSLGAFVDGRLDPGAGADVDSHGTHVCGTIGARATGLPSAPMTGVAPGVDLHSARVFGDGTSGADQGDIALAIDALSQQRGVHLINLSLGATMASQIERDAIADALDHGTLCVCAAGNNAPDAPAVCYPAAFPEAVAVSALGLDGIAPLASVSGQRLPSRTDQYAGGLFLANFSCFGPEIAAAAPGVAIVAPVPERFGFEAPFQVMDGTSMASPMACAALARVLSSDAAFLALPADRARAERARQLLIAYCSDLGLDRRYQGSGICLG